MGARLLRAWILRPEILLAEIEDRLDAVATLKSRTVEREEIHKELENILDLERLTSRVTLGIATPRDLNALRGSLDKIPTLRALIDDATAKQETSGTGGPACQSRLRTLREQLDDLPEVRQTIAQGIADDPPAMPNDPGVIRAGFNSELDELREILQHGRQTIAAMEERERKRTGIASLKK